jgi:peptidoglycan hydrolase-like protein with peptidoglycan-binding domain
MKSTNTKNKKQPVKKGGKKWLLIGLGSAATAALTYFGWKYWKGSQEQSFSNDSNETDFTSNPAPSYKRSTKAQTQNIDSFPLKKGSKGENVKALQQALISKYGKSILPKYGADGDFGSELTAALKKSGLPETIDETTFNVLVKGSSPDPVSTAAQLYNAVLKKDYAKVIALLKGLRSTSDYKNVSNAFMNYRINGVRQTLVNAVLSAFSDSSQKQALQLAFSSMGLKYDGNKWSLAGIGSNFLITNKATKVWKNPKNAIEVPANMVLGKEITKRKNFTLFENNNQYFLVESQHVNHYK